MKKLAALILALVLVLPVSALAFEDEIDTDYGYAHMEVSSDGSPYMAVIYFAEDHTCYYLAQFFHHDAPGIGRAYVGTWEYTDEGYVHAKIGENSEITFRVFSSMNAIVDRKTMDVYDRFDALMK